MAGYTEDLTAWAEIKYAGVRYTRAVAREVGRDAKRLCPVDTGALRASIWAEADGRTVRIWVGNNPRGDGVDYWAHVEFGTSRMAAQPFLRPSVWRRRKVNYLIDDPRI